MKLSCTLLLLLFIFNISQAQPWLKNLPDKSRNELTLPDFQQAFEEYWAPFEIEKGFYFDNGVKKKAYGWKQFKRWEYEMESQVDPITGAFPGKTAQQIVTENRKNNLFNRSGNASAWKSLGPFTSRGGYGGVGRINCIAFHPTNTQTYWVGAPAGGIWVTHDNGSGWTSLTDKLAQIGVSDIVIPSDYETSQTIYIATGDRDSWDTRSIGVLKSTDNGSTWEPTDLSYSIGDEVMVNRLLIDPVNPQILIAATNHGVYKTTDGGADWDSLVSPVEFIDMEFKPGNSRTLYGSTKDGRIFLSRNGGNSFLPAFYHSQAARIEMAVTPHNPQYVYAVAGNNDNGLHSILQSTDGGLSFHEVFSGDEANLLNWEADGQGGGGQAWYDLCIAASPRDANTVLVGGINTWRSQDGGTTWEIVNHWVGHVGQEVHADKHNLVYRSNGDLFECNDGGVYISQDEGTFWVDRTHGIAISQMYRLGVSATDPGLIITGLQDNGSKLQSGNEWHDILGGDGMECLIDYTNPDIQYGEYYFGRMVRTMDHWLSAIDLHVEDDGGWVTPFMIDPVKPNKLYAGFTEVWMTTDYGDLWYPISAFGTSRTLRAMAIAPTDTNTLYVADHIDCYKTHDGGLTWETITGNLPFGQANIEYITVSHEDPMTLWVAVSSYSSPGVYQSADGGITWQNISQGLPKIPVHTVVRNIDFTSEVHLYAGTEVGVYVKRGDENWIEYNNNLPNVRVNELEIYYGAEPSASRLRAATYGRGMWETRLEEMFPAPAAGVANADSSVCYGSSATIYLHEFYGAISWQDSMATDTSWSYVEEGSGQFTSSYNTAALSGNTYYRAEVSQGNHAPVYSNAVFVQVKPVPDAPVITADNDYLISNATEGEHQWYDEEGPVDGATSVDFLASVTGEYYVIVTMNGCSSPPSNILEVLVTSVGNVAVNQQIKLYPNPVDHEMIIELPGNTKSMSFVVYGPSGQKLLAGKILDKAIVRTADLVAGTYVVRFADGRAVEFLKVGKKG